MLRGAVARGLVAIAALAIPHAAAARDREPARAVWVGLDPGPLSTTRAEEVEALLLDALRAHDSFRVVDAAGRSLDERQQAADLARMTRLFDEGIDLLLNFKQKKAVARLDEAIALFEARLIGRLNHDPHHDALLAKAEALHQLGRVGPAMEVLRSLAALSPVHEPTRKTHPPRFVALWEKARADLGAPGRLTVPETTPAPRISIDGRPLEGTSASLPSGRHLVAIAWPFFTEQRAVEITSGRTYELELERTGPGEVARRALLEAALEGRGVEASIAPARGVAAEAGAQAVFVGVARAGADGEVLRVARHDATGALQAVVEVSIAQSSLTEATATTLERLGSALFTDDASGERAIGVDGEARSAPGLGDRTYGSKVREDDRSTGRLAMIPNDPDAGLQTKGPIPRAVGQIAFERTPPTGREDEDHGITGTWWFWALVGAVVLGGAAAGGSVLFRPEPRSTRVLVRIVEDGP